MNRPYTFIALLLLIVTACQPLPPATTPPPPPPATLTSPPTLPPTFTPAPTFTPTPQVLVPPFQHIVIIVFENKEFGKVIGNPKMPTYNRLASQYTLLTQHYAVTHPSLPNYLSLIGGDTFGITTNCEDCFIDAPNLADLIEESGRSWKTYQEDMPAPCFTGSKGEYAQKHNPFIYFDAIRLNSSRCEASIRPLADLFADLAAGALPNFVFITPNLCHSAHDCELAIADQWLSNLTDTLLPALDASGAPYLVILTWDEGQGNHSCCGLPPSAGGRVATVLISPQAKNGFQDDTPYTHYSILKTIAEAWGLPFLGHAGEASNAIIVAPWK
jgi:acid phosphatase